MSTNSPLIEESKLTIISNKVSGLIQRLSTNLATILEGDTSANYKSNKKIILMRKWTDASNNYKNAPLELSLAEKQYYEYNSGEPNGNDIYNSLIIDRFANNAEDLKKNSIQKQQEFMTDITQILKQYQGEKLTAIRTKQLLKIRQTENENLKKKMEMYNRILQTSERKVVYEINNTTSLHTWRRALLFIYYAAIICYIIFSNFIPDKMYLNKTNWLIIVIISLIPFILNLVIKWIFVIFNVLAYWFKERPYKDIYADLR